VTLLVSVAVAVAVAVAGAVAAAVAIAGSTVVVVAVAAAMATAEPNWGTPQLLLRLAPANEKPLSTNDPLLLLLLFLAPPRLRAAASVSTTLTKSTHTLAGIKIGDMPSHPGKQTSK